MPTLLKQGNYYYSQFYNSDKKPQRKRIALKTTYKSIALQLHRKLEKKHALGLFDAWSGFDATASELPLSKNSRLGGDVLSHYITQKSREDWRDRTARDTTYVLRAFERVTGSEKPISCLCATDFNDYIIEKVLPLPLVTVTAPSLNLLLGGASRISY